MKNKKYVKQNLWLLNNPVAAALGRSGFLGETKLRFRHAPLIIQNTKIQYFNYQNTKYWWKEYKLQRVGFCGFLEVRQDCVSGAGCHTVTGPFFQKLLERRRQLFVKDSTCSIAFTKCQETQILFVETQLKCVQGWFVLCVLDISTSCFQETNVNCLFFYAENSCKERIDTQLRFWDTWLVRGSSMD